MSTGADSGRARVFFALWPDDAVRDALSMTAAAARGECGGRMTPPEKIHLTLFFVGDIERARILALERAAALVHAASFDLVVDRLGRWRHNRIVWAGAAACPPGLTALAARLHDALAGVGVDGEERPYAPHITLLRNAERAPVRTTLPPCVWRVREFVLVESTPAGNGVRYDVRARWPL